MYENSSRQAPPGAAVEGHPLRRCMLEPGAAALRTAAHDVLNSGVLARATPRRFSGCGCLALDAVHLQRGQEILHPAVALDPGMSRSMLKSRKEGDAVSLGP